MAWHPIQQPLVNHLTIRVLYIRTATRGSRNSIQFDAHAPLRLSIGAKLAFPDGSMTASGLRLEAARGRLRIERIADENAKAAAKLPRRSKQLAAQHLASPSRP